MTDTTRIVSGGEETGIETTGAAIVIGTGTTTATETVEEATGDEMMNAGSGDVTEADLRVARGSVPVTGIGIGIGNVAETVTGTETGLRAERGGETVSVIETGGESELLSFGHVVSS